MFSTDKALLLIIDVQGKLARMVEDHEKLTRNIRALVQAADILRVPVIYTEQAPDKIGETIPEIKNMMTNVRPVIKPTFSCCRVEAFNKQLKASKRKELIVSGIETHVCVYQTVSDLLERGFAVQLVVDAVSSRGEERREVAVRRMEDMGAQLTTTEMVITELLRTTAHPHFKDILKLMKE